MKRSFVFSTTDSGMCRIRMYNRAIVEAKKSRCLTQHGALVVRKRQVYATGHNTAMRSRFLSEHDLCVHAEMAAATMFINHFVRRRAEKFRSRRARAHGRRRPHEYDLSEFTVWSIRPPSKDASTTSMPCAMCIARLTKWGFGKIVYTSAQGELVMIPLCRVENTHISSALRGVFLGSGQRPWPHTSIEMRRIFHQMERLGAGRRHGETHPTPRPTARPDHPLSR